MLHARIYVVLATLSLMSAFSTGVQAAEVSFNLRLEAGRVPESMRVLRVKEGDVVRLRWSVDRPAILHLHGYDIEKRVDPGVIAEMTFTARATGRFPLHAHPIGAAAAGGQTREEAPLLYVEVYPS